MQNLLRCVLFCPRSRSTLSRHSTAAFRICHKGDRHQAAQLHSFNQHNAIQIHSSVCCPRPNIWSTTTTKGTFLNPLEVWKSPSHMCTIGTVARFSSSAPEPPTSQPSSSSSERKENIFTIPNLLTLSRIVLTPVLGYCVLHEWYLVACSIFVYAGATDLLDGWIARKYISQMSSFGSFLDPLADKLLVSTLFITLSMMQLIPMPLTAIVISRDIGLIVAAFYVRYISLPPPKTLQRYFNATHVTSNLKPLFISKLNTALQLALVALTLPAPVFSYVDHVALQALWCVTGATTISSGIAYMFAKDTFKIISDTKRKRES